MFMNRLRLAAAFLSISLLASCASLAGGGAGVNQPAPLQFDLTAVEVAVSKGDFDSARGLIEADLDNHRYMQAYEAIQLLRDAEPNGIKNLELLARACFGLGLFDEAAASYYAIYQQNPDNYSALLKVTRLLIERGDRARARQLLEPHVERFRGFYPTQLMLQTTDDLSEQLALVDGYLKRYPEDEDALDAKAALMDKAEMGGAIRIVSGQGEVVKAKLSERFVVSVELNDRKLRLLFDTGAYGLILWSDTAVQIGAEHLGKTRIRGVGASGEGPAYNTIIGLMEMGNVTFADIPALVVKGAHPARDFCDGIIGPDIFAGWAYLLDRKGGNLELYPPEIEPSPLAETAMTLRYHTVGHYILTDIGIRNRVSGVGWQVKGFLDTGANNTVFNSVYAKQLAFGEINSTETTRFMGLTGFTQGIQVNHSEVQFAGARFEFPAFWAIEDLHGGRFSPYALLGRDILTRYKILIDPKTHMASFELY